MRRESEGKAVGRFGGEFPIAAYFMHMHFSQKQNQIASTAGRQTVSAHFRRHIVTDNNIIMNITSTVLAADCMRRTHEDLLKLILHSVMYYLVNEKFNIIVNLLFSFYFLHIFGKKKILNGRGIVNGNFFDSDLASLKKKKVEKTNRLKSHINTPEVTFKKKKKNSLSAL